MVLLPQFSPPTFKGPKHNTKGKALLLYAILKGYKMNVGNIIETSILNYYRNNYRRLIPHPTTITRLCILGR